MRYVCPHCGCTTDTCDSGFTGICEQCLASIEPAPTYPRCLANTELSHSPNEREWRMPIEGIG